jgi:GDP-mannose 6-dehydrogenase
MSGMKVAIFGLGYVGCVSAACLARRGHSIVGVDVDHTKVDMVNAGRSPIIEGGLEDLIASGVASGKLSATTDAIEAVCSSDLSLVCVGTPSNGNGSLRLDYVERVAEQIGEGIRQTGPYHLVVLRSTVLPGTVESRLRPILERSSGRTTGKGFGLAVNPEFLREGSALHDFEHPSAIVIGEWDTASGDATAHLYGGLSAPLFRTTIRVAEAVKYVANVFHALKVTFANEIGNVCKACGVDSHDVMRIFCADTQLNLSPAYLKPGFAYGGSCLPKDLRAFIYEGRSRDVEIPLLEAISRSNDQHKLNAFRLIQRTGKRRIGILGLSFKAGTDDLRESPTVELAEVLLGKGYQVAIYDSNVSLASIFGANKAYIEGELPHIASLLRERVSQVLEESDVVVVANQAAEFFSVPARLREGQILIDLVRLPDVTSARGQYVGICW